VARTTTLTAGERDRVDVLVIGAGVSGAVVAGRLVEAGVSVVCLEQGDWTDPAGYPGATEEAELLAAGRWSSSPAVRDGRADYPIDCTDSDVGVLNFNGVGGGSVLYNAQWPRMVPEVFTAWPISYEDLRPWYEATDRAMGVSALGGNPAYPPGEDPPLPPLPIGQLGLRVARAHARLGWHWWPAANAILSAPYRDRRPCVQRGTCGSGCNEGAKASTDVTHWPEYVRRGGQLVTGATVRRILVDRRGLASGVEWVDRDGTVHHQAADVVVLAANAIGSARLLLASDGLANSSGLVGRNLMLHPLVSVAGLFEGPPAGYRAHNGALIQSLEFARRDPSRGFVGGATWALGSAGGPLRHALAPDGRGRWGPAHHEHVRHRLGRTASWVIIAEDQPEHENRVQLSSDLTDHAGVAAPRITYRLAENTDRLMRWNVERAKESLREAGAWQVEEIRHRANGHFMGTARMGTDPSTSVVDPWCAAHDVPNLLIVDGSVFVTAGSANPTSTIAALALRAAEHLVERFADVPKPEHRVLTQVPPAPPALSTTAPVEQPVEPLTPAERAVLRQVADILIPAGDGMPSAAAVGIADDLVDRVLAVRPDLAGPLRVALARCTPDLDALIARNDAELAALRYVVAGAYYLAAGVRAAIDYRPEDVTPVRALDFPEYLEEGLLDHLVEVTP
jgi:choline dehydrogenase-like flavoprotein